MYRRRPLPSRSNTTVPPTCLDLDNPTRGKAYEEEREHETMIAVAAISAVGPGETLQSILDSVSKEQLEAYGIKPFGSALH